MSIDESLKFDPNLCSGCGACIDVCPFENISLADGQAVFEGDTCISCGHCAAACQQAAIQVPAIDEGMGEYQTFIADRRWLPHGQYDIVSLARLMGSRRSCRNFVERPVDRSILEDLVRIGITAPSGTNSQKWTFTIVPTKTAVTTFASYISSFFKKLNAMAEKTFLRTALKLIGKGELDQYYRNYYSLVKKAIEEWEESGKDRLFHGAAAAIIVGSKPGATCPSEDALLATQNILLAAHSMGLGSCLIGFAVSAMKEAPEIKPLIGIPAEETVYAVIALGYPDESYETVAGRKKAETRYSTD
jgi:nitroreductase/NAD-dependent dihydropyrimidine dehydrogenase PreA subunit